MLPEQFPHIFVEVVFQILPEIDYGDLCYLSQIARSREDTAKYRSLVDALRKIQWAKLAALEATSVEGQIQRELEEAGSNVLVQEPVGQVRHAKALFDFVAHAKAATDSIAVFLTDYLPIEAKGGDRDFRKATFRDKVIKSDPVVGQEISSLSGWLDAASGSSESLVAVRDHWLHRGSPGISLVLPKPEVGLLPIPRRLAEGERANTAITAEHYWSTTEFVAFHIEKLAKLFSVVVRRCIELEVAALADPPARAGVTDAPVAATPVLLTENVVINRIRLGQMTSQFFGLAGGPTPRS